MKNTVILLTLILSVLFSCNNQKDILDQKPKSLTIPETASCKLIEKELTNKGGKITEYKELYLRCSIQDYFIKICEGNVTRKELIPYLNKGITVNMEIRNGVWDFCNDNPAYAQSRSGTYVIIKSIKK